MIEDEKNHDIKMRDMAQDSILRQNKALEEADIEFTRQTNENQVKFLSKMKEMGVDLTKYLVSQYQNPEKVIRIDTGAPVDGANRANIHLHEK